MAQHFDLNTIVPEQIHGKANDLEESVILQDAATARKTFTRACMRLKNVPLWHTLTGEWSAEFVLAGNKGQDLKRLAKEGDHFRIDIPGPGMLEGDGYDWVKVLKVFEADYPESNTAIMALTIGPTSNPTNNHSETAHFFKEGASSTFIITLEYDTVTVSYHARNEVPNTDVSRTLDKIRNTLVSIGAYGGLSEMQWKSLIASFLKEEL